MQVFLIVRALQIVVFIETHTPRKKKEIKCTRVTYTKVSI